jgi:hypothetical protein
MSTRFLLPFVLLMAAPAIVAAVPPRPSLTPEQIQSTVDRLVARHGETFAVRIRTGVRQVAERWWTEDGDAAAFATFCGESFIQDEATLAQTFKRLEAVLEQIDGHLLETRRELLRPSDLDTGPVSTLDQMLGTLDLQAHVDDDLFRTKVAFVMLLNFPLHTLGERLEHGGSWDRETWARSRLMDRFALRVPAEVTQEATRAFTEADRYIADYNIRMDRLVDREGKRPFPDGLRLISHWGLRDELASHYGEDGALPKQRLIQTVMERIVRQEIPVQVIDNPDVLWSPQTNDVKPAPGARAGGAPTTTAREPDTRYEKLLEVFRAAKQADVYAPTAPTFIARRFELDRQIPVKDVEALLVSVLESDEIRALAAEIEKRLGRPLEPFDIWYSGFKSRGGRSERDLDDIVRSKYPTVAAFQADVPSLLVRLGFTKDKAEWLAERIVVDPSRGAGHAMGAVRREDRAHLRTRIPSSGMNYKGFNIAVHELGHNVEQVFSLHGIDHWALYGVPNNAFTEAFAFVLQNRDLELLGLGAPNATSRGREALATLWATYEIAGVALVDMKVWDWMYARPDAKPAQLREATLAIARDVWNRYFAPVFKTRDVELLAIYSHMISNGLYLPDYPLGHIIAFQIAAKLRDADFATEFERMARQGRLTPDAWMRGAVGEPISSKALLAEARRALENRSR